MSQSCYYPDSSLVGADDLHPVMIPCDPQAETSACCHKGDVCYANGLCGSDYWWPYRGACTDKTWKSKACPSFCASAASGGVLDSYQIISSCEDPRMTPRKFACADTQAGCSKGNFSMATSKVMVANLTAADAGSSTTTVSPLSQSSRTTASPTTSLSLSLTTTAVSIATSCTSSAATTAEKAMDSGISRTVLGISISIPLLIALVLAIFLFLEHKKRMGLQKDQAERTLVGSNPPAPSTTYSSSQAEPKSFEYGHMSPDSSEAQTPKYNYAPKFYPGPPRELAEPEPGELQGEGEFLRAK